MTQAKNQEICEKKKRFVPLCPYCGKRLNKISYTNWEYSCCNPDCKIEEIPEFYGYTQEEINDSALHKDKINKKFVPKNQSNNSQQDKINGIANRATEKHSLSKLDKTADRKTELEVSPLKNDEGFDISSSGSVPNQDEAILKEVFGVIPQTKAFYFKEGEQRINKRTFEAIKKAISLSREAERKSKEEEINGLKAKIFWNKDIIENLKEQLKDQKEKILDIRDKLRNEVKDKLIWEFSGKDVTEMINGVFEEALKNKIEGEKI